jgi:hypothetical protein
VESPLHRIEHFLQPWVSFFIMPLFAFANAGVRILGNVTAAARHPASLGVALGLFLGKPVGIWLFARLSVGVRLATPPAEVSWGKIFGASWLCGIGFTMSLFIANLAFGEGALLDMAKIGTLAASVGAGLCGSIFLLRRGKTTASAQLDSCASGGELQEASPRRLATKAALLVDFVVVWIENETLVPKLRRSVHGHWSSLSTKISCLCSKTPCIVPGQIERGLDVL